MFLCVHKCGIYITEVVDFLSFICSSTHSNKFGKLPCVVVFTVSRYRAFVSVTWDGTSVTVSLGSSRLWWINSHWGSRETKPTKPNFPESQRYLFLAVSHCSPDFLRPRRMMGAVGDNPTWGSLWVTSALPDCGDSFDSDSSVTYEQSHNSWLIAVHFNADRGVELWHRVSNVIYYHFLLGGSVGEDSCVG